MRLHHVGIAVEDLEAAKARYLLLGYRVLAEGEVAAQGVRVAMLQGEGETLLELLAPLGPDTPVGRFLAKRGPGLHHLAFATPRILEDLARLRQEGAQAIDETPRPGFGGHRVAFLHPSFGLGVLWELVEEA
ncbi:MAG: methylmalonyl-CoA epimerase [Thermus sp.]|uniref:methylmalonyl-CoA epimerase n=1 Tax=Thermus sp. TaxID=275 RepID=UPI0025D83A9D|nr:methylmalonyl-CoA epimerase [Thermus sp.]MCS6868253.1 methylmalonyl-CoA epimerase [Thermus sp.]MCS7218664.1 methylmalonyl-CoA epimerase [Thermus sp.]MCX7848590.1 methylmalonyl-CoA epimerase [Thermus sp.]MDW8017909.1 methylmalonyl-CoA epimerase [Thermus sp.]